MLTGVTMSDAGRPRRLSEKAQLANGGRRHRLAQRKKEGQAKGLSTFSAEVCAEALLEEEDVEPDGKAAAAASLLIRQSFDGPCSFRAMGNLLS